MTTVNSVLGSLDTASLGKITEMIVVTNVWCLSLGFPRP